MAVLHRLALLHLLLGARAVRRTHDDVQQMAVMTNHFQTVHEAEKAEQQLPRGFWACLLWLAAMSSGAGTGAAADVDSLSLGLSTPSMPGDFANNAIMTSSISDREEAVSLNKAIAADSVAAKSEAKAADFDVDANGVFVAARSITHAEARTALANGANYLMASGILQEVKDYFENDGWKSKVKSWQAEENGVQEWESTLIGQMEDLAVPEEGGVNVDDHKGTPIGNGDSIGLVGAEVQMEEGWMQDLPEDFRSGLFGRCGGGTCQKWASAVRVSHTQAAGVDLTRIALKINTGSKVVDLHFTETLKAFPIANKQALEAFSYSMKHGMGWALLKYPIQFGKMGLAAHRTKASYEQASKMFGVLGKDYYSLTPFKIGGGERGEAASAMKFRLHPHERESYPLFASDVHQAYREQLARSVYEEDHVFDLEIQVATDPAKHPVNDASVEWDEATAPWVKMGQVRIPKQTFPEAPDGDHQFEGITAGESVGSALWKGDTYSPQTDLNSKDLLFAPGESPHEPLGDINAFRADFYPKYDEARQKHLLGKTNGMPSKCPFHRIMSWF